jgi:hypothetical protein
MVICSKMMSKIESIEYYLESFGSKENFTLKNAIKKIYLSISSSKCNRFCARSYKR